MFLVLTSRGDVYLAEDSIVLKGILKKLRNFTLLFDELFVLLRNFPFSAREAMHDYYL